MTSAAGLGRRALRGSLAALALLLSLQCAGAEPGSHHTLWEVRGKQGSVLLLGSVHLLQGADTLPAEIITSYRDAECLMMELDPFAPDSLASPGAALAMALLPADQTLEQALGPALYARFHARATDLGVDESLYGRMQPWFAAMTLELAALGKAGFDAGNGVDLQLAERARADGKPIIGLETLAEQLGYFAALSTEEQRQFVSATLDEVDDVPGELAGVIAAWKRGDTAELEAQLGQAYAESPELFTRLVVERNQHWLPRLDALLKQGRHCMVVVGALHLVGKAGLLALLQRQGYIATQR